MGRLFDSHQLLLQQPLEGEGWSGSPTDPPISSHIIIGTGGGSKSDSNSIIWAQPCFWSGGAALQARSRASTAFNSLDAGLQFLGSSTPSQPRCPGRRPHTVTTTATLFTAEHPATDAAAPAESGEHHGTDDDPHAAHDADGEHEHTAHEEHPGILSRLYGKFFSGRKEAPVEEANHLEDHPHDEAHPTPEEAPPAKGESIGKPPPESSATHGEDILSPVELSLKNDAVKRIAKVNARDLALYNKIMQNTAAVPAVRTEMDKAMTGHMSRVRALCQQYMEDRARLRGPGGTRCVAVQGRVNAASLPHSADTESDSLSGCLEEEPQGNAEAGLPLGKCSNGHRELGCMRRLNDLMQHRPAPGEKPGGLSMDQQVRQWCHYEWYMPAHPVSEELASGMPDPNGPDEFEDEDAFDVPNGEVASA
mmetsp:Transcript_84388/g.176623  ORF Transcript_84388/g.176623 Transcript_84388/m.176623 type:complete len:421 (+) Transcript_84388:106-1368(+)|eukprot:CAMPEP_0206546646 /NCGR_PEP_ID=MMETSP0325_2-20121206/12835_1 /ASSEMBLY_ACC=CAM_ASM_000347 /TAXON_ID=2866 /ORGANISM="Crypthecodinium cohnii, Strain Seligo" /LENGTH=420 /DNA_ID=CAMNT_0054045821 /DNA_START=50 /DNA_END=1312 /DNA_ORIENTATION=-